MINYMKSEAYRLMRNSGLHMTSLVCLFLITAAAIALYFFGQVDLNFPYSNSRFFYANVIGMGAQIIVISVLFNAATTGKELSVLKQSISFGISRNMIYWSKLVLSLGYFLVICIIGIALMIVLGENLLQNDQQSVRNFLIASVNMSPLVLSGFFLTHTLRMLRMGDIYIIIVLILIFGVSSSILRMIFRPFAGLDGVYKYAPDALLSDNLTSYLDGVVQMDSQFWLVGIGISLIALLFGAHRFAKQNIN